MVETVITDERMRRAAEGLRSLAFSRLIGMELTELAHGKAVITVGMRDELSRPGGILHGGVTATVIDTAMAFAVRTLLDESAETATIDLTVHYLRPHSVGDIICTARVVRAGKRIFTVEADVANEDGKLIATGLSTYTRI